MAIVFNDKKFKEAVRWVARNQGKTIQQLLKENNLPKGFVYSCTVRKKSMQLSTINEIAKMFGLKATRFLYDTKSKNNTCKFVPELDLDDVVQPIEEYDVLSDINFKNIDKNTYFFLLGRIASYLKNKFPTLKIQVLIRCGTASQNDLIAVEIVPGVDLYMRLSLDKQNCLYSCIDICSKYSTYDPSLMKKTYTLMDKVLLERFCNIIEREVLTFKII